VSQVDETSFLGPVGLLSPNMADPSYVVPSEIVVFCKSAAIFVLSDALPYHHLWCNYTFEGEISHIYFLHIALNHLQLRTKSLSLSSSSSYLFKDNKNSHIRNTIREIAKLKAFY